MKKCISIILSLLIVLAALCLPNNVSNVYAGSTTITLNASDLKAGKYPEYYDVNTKELNITWGKLLILNMDDTLHLESSILDCAVIIKGTRTLFVDGSITVCGNLELSDDAGIAFNKEESGIYFNPDEGSNYYFTSFGNISAKGAKYAIICGAVTFELQRGTVKLYDLGSAFISIDKDVYINGGSIENDNIQYFARCNNFYMCGGSVDANVNVKFIEAENVRITGGTLDIHSEKIGINAAKTIDMRNATVKATSMDGAAILSSGTIGIENGYVEAFSNYSGNDSTIDKSNYSPILAKQGIIFGDDVEITEPSGGKISTEIITSSQGDVSLYRVVDSNGNWVKKVVIQDKEKVDDSSNSGNQGQGGNEAGGQGGSGNGASGQGGSGNGASGQGGSGNEAGGQGGSGNGASGQGQGGNGASGQGQGGNGASGQNGNGVGGANSSNASSGNASTTGSSGNNSSNGKPKYSNEWVNGKWYNDDGICDYEGILSWKQNETGWWVEDTLGWYPISQWQKIDGKWYYFTSDGYMDYSEYRDGCWLGSDGAWVEDYHGGKWMNNSSGWWYIDSYGWYPHNQYLWIDGVNYWFSSDGYLSE